MERRKHRDTQPDRQTDGRTFRHIEMAETERDIQKKNRRPGAQANGWTDRRTYRDRQREASYLN